jgi:hypothetical protein
MLEERRAQGGAAELRLSTCRLAGHRGNFDA